MAYFEMMERKMEDWIRIWGHSHRGMKRTSNEDAYFLHPNCSVVAVADGMGGAAAGELASFLFIETVKQNLQECRQVTLHEARDIMHSVFKKANRTILDHVKDSPEHKGMGCTAELLLFFDAGFLLGHIGDSRTYRFRKKELQQISRDHSLVQDYIDQGVITPEEAVSHHLRHVIHRAVGIEDELQVDLIHGRYLPGDIYLLCSDGLTDMVEDAQIEEILVAEQDIAHKGRGLIESALSAGGRDNVTVALAEVM